jgi:hypothetical protein
MSLAFSFFINLNSSYLKPDADSIAQKGQEVIAQKNQKIARSVHGL